MEKKIRLAESVRDSTTGHFHWIFTSHENPGRNQSGEGFRELDRVGPVNYKGLLTPWGEPTDAFYMFRSNYAPKNTEPMVYIVSHTWPNRWEGAGVKDGLAVFSNCDEVELFNGLKSLGKKTNQGIGTHFQWDSVSIETNKLTAVGMVNGKVVARDDIVFNHLPKDDVITLTKSGVSLSDDENRNVLYRINCGGSDYVDSNGNAWQADAQKQSNDVWGSTSWTDDFENMPAFFGSQRRTFDPIWNCKDEALFQTFRFGLSKLEYHFPLPNGDYEVELHFVEPWYGTGGGMNCEGWRIYDVAVNERVVIDDLDIWKEAGHDQALIKKVQVNVKNGLLKIHFPEVKSGQAIISAIAISSTNQNILQPKQPIHILTSANAKAKTWGDWGDQPFADSECAFQILPPELFGAEWLAFESSISNEPINIQLNRATDLFIGLQEGLEIPIWLKDFDATKSKVVTVGEGKRTYNLYKKRFGNAENIQIPIANDIKMPYLVFANEANNMEPPYDLKEKIPYDDDVAILITEGAKRETRFGLGCVSIVNQAQNQVAWPIKTGVADYHAIHFKYTNETVSDIIAVFKLVSADGTLMQSSTFVLEKTKEGKYAETTTFTETMINAGDYRVVLEVVNAQGLSIRGIRVQ
jgi:beta-galactosidase